LKGYFSQGDIQVKIISCKYIFFYVWESPQVMLRLIWVQYQIKKFSVVQSFLTYQLQCNFSFNVEALFYIDKGEDDYI
jgi:hypothetical protein